MHRRHLLAPCLLLALATPAAAWAVGGIPVPTPPVGPPTYTVNVNDPAGFQGDIFYGTGSDAAAVGLSVPVVDDVTNTVQPSSLVIADKSGKVLWQHTSPRGETAADFRTQVYRGQKVLTWWEGTSQGGHGAGADYIADSTYKVIKKITLPAPYDADVHEFRLTPDGRALITAYHEVTHDMSSLGGPSSAEMLDTVAFVVDVASGKVLQQWSALDHIPLTDTHQRRPIPPSTVYDPYHLNSIALDGQGNLILSFRNLSAVYGVDLHSGAIRWKLGGTDPTLTAGPGIQFAYQHDAELIAPDVLQLFNDDAAGMDDPSKPAQLVQGFSSVQRIKLDLVHQRATLVSNWSHPDELVAIAMGNAQLLPDGDTLVGWGTASRISELDRNGKLVYDASLPGPTYRAFADTWPGGPVTQPTPSWFVKVWSGRRTSAVVGHAVAVSPTLLTDEGARAGLTVTYRWTAGGRIVSTRQTPGKVPAAWRGKAIKVTVTTSAVGFTTLTKTISLGTVR